MNPKPGLIARRQLLLGMLLGISSGGSSAAGPTGNAPPFPVSQQSSLLERLKVPELSDPWEIDAFFEGVRIKLAFPQALNHLDKLPTAIQDTVKRRIEFRWRNLDVLRKAAIDLDEVLRTNPFTHLAQHEQTLEHVVMALPPIQPNSPEGTVAMHEPLLAALPAYSKVDFFLPEALMGQVASRLSVLGLQKRVHLHGEDEFELIEDKIPLRYHTTYWMRDVVMASADKHGNTPLLLPLAFYQINDLSRPDNNYVHKLRNPKRPVIRIPLFFKGGNMMVISYRQRRILLIGQDELRLNQEFYYNAFFYFPPPDAVLDLFRRIAGADDVRVIPNSKNLYHLDMVMAVVQPGTAALLDPVDSDQLRAEDREVISRVRDILAGYGQRIVGIPTLSDWVGEFKSPVNILPFRHRDTRVLSAIVPQFDERIVTTDGRSASIHEMIRKAYRGAGVETIFASSGLFRSGGNWHCAVLPIA